MIYCPRCAAQNIEDAKFCRSCGTDIGFVAQALTGNLPVPAPHNKKVKAKKPATIEGATEDFFVGIAFLLIVVGGAMFFTGGFMIWIWFLIPGFACVGSGIGKYLQFRHEQQSAVSDSSYNFKPPSFINSHARETEELPVSDAHALPCGSVTDGTTRLFDTLDDVPRSGSAVRVEPAPERRPRRS